MYLWCLLPAATSAPPVDEGISPDLATAMRVTEPWLASPLVFMLAIRELVPRISVDDLVPGWVPTGREWHARRAIDESARWSTRRFPVDPEVVYFLRPPAEPAAEPAAEPDGEPAGEPDGEPAGEHGEDSRDAGSSAPHPDAPR